MAAHTAPVSPDNTEGSIHHSSPREQGPASHALHEHLAKPAPELCACCRLLPCISGSCLLTPATGPPWYWAGFTPFASGCAASEEPPPHTAGRSAETAVCCNNAPTPQALNQPQRVTGNTPSGTTRKPTTGTRPRLGHRQKVQTPSRPQHLGHHQEVRRSSEGRAMCQRSTQQLPYAAHHGQRQATQRSCCGRMHGLERVGASGCLFVYTAKPEQQLLGRNIRFHKAAHQQ